MLLNMIPVFFVLKRSLFQQQLLCCRSFCCYSFFFLLFFFLVFFCLVKICLIRYYIYFQIKRNTRSYFLALTQSTSPFVMIYHIQKYVHECVQLEIHIRTKHHTLAHSHASHSLFTNYPQSIFFLLLLFTLLDPQLLLYSLSLSLSLYRSTY